MIRLLTSVLLFSFWVSVKADAQESSAYRQFQNYIHNAKGFNFYLPQEKVYLHLDNTCYYIGDTLWFNAYVVTADSFRYTNMSKVLYVELLSPEGSIVDRRKLEISQGQCHGEFALNKLFMYSGYYEIRAYTRYMMNFGKEAGFSRVIHKKTTPKGGFF